MVEGINQKRISANFKSIKVRCFNRATIDDMYFHLIPLLSKKTPALVLHVGTKNSSNQKHHFSFTINCKAWSTLLKKTIRIDMLHCFHQSIGLMMERQLSLLRSETNYYQNPHWTLQKQPPRGVPRKRCSENMQQIYRRTSIPKCDFNKVALNLLKSHFGMGVPP